MNTPFWSAVLLIIGFVLVIIASVAGPQSLYREPDVNKQLQIVADHGTAWLLSNLFFGLAAVVTAVGLVLFALHQRAGGGGALAAAGAGAYILGAAAFAFFLYRRAVDPASLFTNYRFSPLTVLMLGSLTVGLLLFGMAILQAGYPGWLGAGLIAGMALIGGLALLFPVRFFKSFAPQAFFLFTLLAGVVMVGRTIP
jgi:hypothetical protein